MTFTGSGSIDTGNVSGGGGGGGGGGGRIALGGGAGLIITVVALLFGINPGQILGGAGGDGANSSASTEIQQQLDACTYEKANTDTLCRVKATTVSLDRVWGDIMPGYRAPKTIIFSQSVNTACGAASSDTGPFYCPADRTAYFDVSFFDLLANRLGGSDGPLAQEYVVAHEYGHHVQNLTGALSKGQRMGSQGARSGSVRVELQADCLAGVWANHADDGPDALLAPITEDQLATVIQTAKAIGDDTLQGANSNPEGWTHGSAEQRARWFSIGYKSGDQGRCDTFATNDL